MKDVCVITGGGSGMGLAAAKCMPKEKILVLSGRTVVKLEKPFRNCKVWAMKRTPSPAIPPTGNRCEKWQSTPQVSETSGM